jgi:hypothetical protein
MNDLDEYDAPVDISKHDASPWPAEPLSVVNVTQRNAPEYGACMTWPVGQAGTAPQATQVLQRRIKRFKAKLSVTAVSGATAIVINSKADALNGNPGNPQGATYFVAAGANFNLPDWESQQPLYAIAIGGTLNLTVIDEAYAER